MIKIIHNADDFGYSRAVNYGILDAHTQGFLTSTTLMANMPGFNHAVALAKKHPSLGIGVHLTLTCGYPLLKDHKTLLREDGYFKKLAFYEDCETSVDDEEIYKEWKAQIEKVIEQGIYPTHVDSHHHIHTFKNNVAIIIRLAKEYDLPVRNAFQSPDVYRKHGIKCNDVLINPWQFKEEHIMQNKEKTALLAHEIIRQLRLHEHSQCIEVMWHPAYLDAAIMEGSAWVLARLCENDVITNDELIAHMKSHYQLCNYTQLQTEEKFYV